MSTTATISLYDYTLQQFPYVTITLCNNSCPLELHSATIPVLRNYTLQQFCPLKHSHETTSLSLLLQFPSLTIALCNNSCPSELHSATIPVLRNYTLQQFCPLKHSLETTSLSLLLQFPSLMIALCNNSCLLVYASPLNTTQLGYLSCRGRRLLVDPS